MFRSFFFVFGLFFFSVTRLIGQGTLDKKISISLHKRSLSHALAEISHKGDFNFSYNTRIINGDSIVSLHADNLSIRNILEQLLGGNYDFEESGKYVIIVIKANSPPVKIYTVSGYIKDEATQQKVSNVSVYESQQLVSALSDSSGFFKLRLRDKYAHATLIISKQLYRDTLLYIQPGTDQQFSITITHEKVADLAPFVVSNRVERTWFGKFFLSSKEIVQSMNLSNFFANKPIQFSFTPGLGSHGKMGGQVVNKFSVNFIGGYTAGINGVEFAGVFNIDKKEVKYVQAAGVFNMAGGNVKGVQLAGIHNHDLDSVSAIQAGGISNLVLGSLSGVQLAGVINVVEGPVKGVQAAGIYNLDLDSVKGVQLSGLFNRVDKSMHGVQVAGILNQVKGPFHGMQISSFVNIAHSTMSGVQISDGYNYAHKSTGVQIGLINFADTASGYMIGLVNIVKHGVREIVLSSNELLPATVAYKAGSPKMYTILQIGMDPSGNERKWGYGVGVGHQVKFSENITWSSDITSWNLYNWKGQSLPNVFRLQSIVQLKVGRHLAVFAGPACSLYDPNQRKNVDVMANLPHTGYQTFAVGNARAWIGWSGGLSINFNKQ